MGRVMAYRYQTLWIPNWVPEYSDGMVWEQWIDVREENPDRQKLRDGAYLPPEGSRIIGFEIKGVIHGGGITLMLEYEFASGDPYR